MQRVANRSHAAVKTKPHPTVYLPREHDPSSSNEADFVPSSTTSSAPTPGRHLNHYSMEAAGLSIISEARTNANNISTRIANIRHAPVTFRILTEELNRLTRQLARVEELLQTTQGAILDEVATNVKDTLEFVRDTLVCSSSTVEMVCSKAFPARASGCRHKLKSAFRRTFRAKAISNSMKDLQPPLQEASSQLLSLTSMLTERFNVQEHQDIIAPDLGNLRITGSVEDVHRGAPSMPLLPPGTTLNFGAQDASIIIFMMHATRDATRKAPRESTGTLRRSVATILTICAGHPIALAVAGCTVSFLAKERVGFEAGCDEYASQLWKKTIELGEEQGLGGTSLDAVVSLGLKILEAEFLKLKTTNAVVTDHSIANLYTSLCVLRNEAWVPVAVLCRLWKVHEYFAFAAVCLLSGLSLCKLTFRQVAQGAGKEGGLMLHDLLLDFCKRRAETMKTSSLWHSRLLDGYLEPDRSTSEGPLLIEQGVSFEDRMFECTPRPWWSVSDDGYIHVDLARHLSYANLEIELAALLLDARWTHVRFGIGGILSLKSDFERLVSLGGGIPHRVSEEFKLICKAIQLSWARVSEGKRSFLLQVCGRLLRSRTDNAIVDSFLKSVEKHTPVPYLRPVNRFFLNPLSAQVMEIPLGATCWTLNCSPCGRFLAAGADSDVVVADVSTGEILKRLKGHTEIVTCVSFAVGSKKIVAGSLGKSVLVWEWETSESPVHVLEGHSACIRGVAVSSKGSKIFSCSQDCTLRSWDANTGAQIGIFLQKNTVVWVAVTNDDQSVAIGLKGGSLKVLDSCTGNTVFEDSNAHEDDILCVAFNASDELLATGSEDKTIRVWNTATWMTIGEPLQGHTYGVECIAFSPDGQRIASGSWDGTARLWDANTGRNIWTSSDMRSYVCSVAFALDGERIISGCGNGNICVWDTCLEAEANELEYAHSGAVLDVAISDNGLLVASASEDGTVCLWDSLTGKQIARPMEGHTDLVRCVSFSHDGRQMVSGSEDKTVRLWDTMTLKQIGSPLEGHTDTVRCVSFSSDGLRIVSGSKDKTIRIWDAESGLQIGDALEGHTARVSAVSESCDGCHVVSRDYSDAVIIWNRGKRSIVWESTQRLGHSAGETSSQRHVLCRSHDDCGTRYEMTQEEAEKTIRSCGQATPHLWPDSFPPYTSELYCRRGLFYSNVPTEDTVLGTLPPYVYSWSYHEARKLFVAAFASGTIGVCNMKM